MLEPVQGLRFSYALHELPAGRFGFRRWRWELWHGERLHATGWRGTPRDAEHTLRTYAVVNAHRFFGLLVPSDEVLAELGGAGEPLRRGAAVRLTAGPVSLLLVPRGLDQGDERLAVLAS